MLVPQVSAWAERRGQSPSRYLMPLSFAAILGGVVTAIGTSTNLVISGLLEASGEPPLGMFEISSVGLPVALIGLILIVLLAPALIPERRSVGAELDEEFREFVLNMLVTPGGPLDGKTVEEGGLRHLDHPILSCVSEDEARRQIRDSKARIESELDRTTTAFAYPNGRAIDFDAVTKRILNEEGFRCAVTTVDGANDATSDPLALRRVGMWGDDPYLSVLRLARARIGA